MTTSRASLFPFFAACLAGCVAIPKAPPGEPVIVEQSAFVGPPVYAQRFSEQGVYPVSGLSMTIAENYALFGARKEAFPAQTIPVRCRIANNGDVSLSGCSSRSDDPLTDEQLAALVTARSFGQVSDFPVYRELPEDSKPVQRTVDLTLETPPIAAVSVDLSSGDMVDFRLVNIPRFEERLAASYPSRALRREIEGEMVMECQIQIDRSVICRTIAFSPSEHSKIFDRVIQRISTRVTSAAQLRDGTDARGVRFQRRVLWRIPNRYPAEDTGVSSAPTPPE